MEWETIPPHAYPQWVVRSLKNDDLRAAWEGGRLLLFSGKSYIYRVAPALVTQGHWDIGRMERQLRRQPRQKRSPLKVVAATAAITAVLVGVAALALADAQGSTQTTATDSSDLPEPAPAPSSILRGGFKCTGSMEPSITCLDEVSVETAFDPQDIQPGTVIEFAPSCPMGADQERRGTSHRAVDVKVEDGLHYYWPKGDANREADGCWIPAHDVTGYVVGIHRNARPENEPLRVEVNRAKADLHDVLDRYCGVGVPVDDCELGSTAEHDEILAVDAAFDCWYRVAQKSEYPGHIPSRC